MLSKSRDTQASSFSYSIWNLNSPFLEIAFWITVPQIKFIFEVVKIQSLK